MRHKVHKLKNIYKKIYGLDQFNYVPGEKNKANLSIKFRSFNRKMEQLIIAILKIMMKPLLIII